MVTGKGLLEAVKAVIATPFKALVWLWFSLMRLVLYVALATALFAAVVMGHGLWHMSHPLDNPKFKGLTYWQLLEWEKMVTDRQAVAWNRAHPNDNPANWQTCVLTQVAVYVFMGYPRAAAYQLMLRPEGKVTEYFRAVDETWENWNWQAIRSPDPMTKFCETAASHPVPTPEELEQYKLEYQAWKAQQEAASQAGK